MDDVLTQAFLDSLIGQTVSQAKQRVEGLGFEPKIVKSGQSYSAARQPGRVIFVYNACKVVFAAHAGDPQEVVNEE